MKGSAALMFVLCLFTAHPGVAVTYDTGVQLWEANHQVHMLGYQLAEGPIIS